MHVLPLLIGTSTAFGVGYFCIDVYRNRRRLATQPNPPADVFYDTIPSPDGDDCQAVGQTVSRAAHAVDEASHSASYGVEHCIESITHTLSHH